MSALMQLAAAVMLLCAFLLMSKAGLPGMIRLYRLQGIALTAAALSQAYAQGDLALCLAGLITFCLGVVLLPNALHRIAPRFPPTRATPSATPGALTLVLAIGLVGVALLVIPPTPLHINLAIALAVLLLGLLLMARSHSPVSQIIGFLSLGNGLLLAAIAMPDVPFVAWLAAALPLLGLSLLSLALMQMQAQP